jgi:hypothetical protein
MNYAWAIFGPEDGKTGEEGRNGLTNGQNRQASAVDLTFATHLACGFVERMSNPKLD